MIKVDKAAPGSNEAKKSLTTALKIILNFSDKIMIFREDSRDNRGIYNSAPFFIVGFLVFLLSLGISNRDIYILMISISMIIFSIPLYAIVISGIVWYKRAIGVENRNKSTET